MLFKIDKTRFDKKIILYSFVIYMLYIFLVDKQQNGHLTLGYVTWKSHKFQ